MARFIYSEELSPEKTTILPNGEKISSIPYSGFLLNFSGECKLETIFLENGYTKSLKVEFFPKGGFKPFEMTFESNVFIYNNGCLTYKDIGSDKTKTIIIVF